MRKRHNKLHRPSKNISETVEEESNITIEKVKKDQGQLIQKNEYLTTMWLNLINNGQFIHWISFKNFFACSICILLLFVTFGKPGVALWIFLMILLIPSLLIVKWISRTVDQSNKVNPINEEDDQGTDDEEDSVYTSKAKKIKEKLKYLKLKQELMKHLNIADDIGKKNEGKILKTFEWMIYYALNMIVMSIVVFGVYFGNMSGLQAFACLVVSLPIIFIIRKIGLIKVSINLSLAILVIMIMIGIIIILYTISVWFVDIGILTK